MSSRSFVNAAKALAYLLAFFIISSMIAGVFFVVSLFANTNQTSEITSIYDENEIIDNLDITLKATSLEIIDSNEFRVDTNNQKIKIDYQNGTLKIKENGTPAFNKGNLVLKVYLPSSYAFKTVKLEMGAGKTDVAYLKTDDLKLQLGAGKTLFEKLEVSTNTTIDSGVGLLEILDGTLNNLDLEAGVGKTDIKASILGESKIECGVGSLDLYLIGSLESYKLNIEKGIGSINVDDKIYSSDTLIGSGENLIKISGGIGSINVKFKN